MAKLNGLRIGDKITEFYGPVTGRNYNTAGAAAPGAPSIIVQVFGEGSVQLEQTNTSYLKGNSGGNVFTHDREADPTTWAALGGVIDQTSGQVILTPTIDASFSAIRATLAGVGAGRVVIQSIWN